MKENEHARIRCSFESNFLRAILHQGLPKSSTPARARYIFLVALSDLNCECHLFHFSNHYIFFFYQAII